MIEKTSTPKGTRDFLPIEVSKLDYIISNLKHVFEIFAFQPIETPSFEYSTTLMGKYGEEGDRLIFKILNSGDYLKGKGVDLSVIERKDSKALTPMISEKALRYDLTVPFARYVVKHRNDITFPFRRYQIQPVWRADRPQKGRYREFRQCDADIVGSKSLWQEVELVQLYDRVFNSLNFNGITIELNNRKVLAGLAEIIGAKDKFIDFTVSLDKLDKIGKQRVIEEMLKKGINREGIKKIEPIFEFTGSNRDKILMLESILEGSEEGLKGVEELKFVNTQTKALGLSVTRLNINLKLARGLNYYTGTIFEVFAPQGVKLGSIGGGGRYDDLTSIFGLKNVSGIGVSFGLDRIYLTMQALGLFKRVERPKPKVLFLNFGEKEAAYAMRAIKELRKKGIKSELYPDAYKLKKQMDYANKLEIDFVAIAGIKEIEKSVFAIKNMKNGKQVECSFDGLLNMAINL